MTYSATVYPGEGRNPSNPSVRSPAVFMRLPRGDAYLLRPHQLLKFSLRFLQQGFIGIQVDPWVLSPVGPSFDAHHIQT